MVGFGSLASPALIAGSSSPMNSQLIASGHHVANTVPSVTGSPGVETSARGSSAPSNVSASTGGPSGTPAAPARASTTGAAPARATDSFTSGRTRAFNGSERERDREQSGDGA